MYQTKHFSDKQLKQLKESANKQEKEIARFFYKNPTVEIGPGRLHEKLGFNWPVTSTRRAINDLTKAGVLLKTDRTSMGVFGKPEYLWKWRDPNKVPTHRELLKKHAGRQMNFHVDLFEDVK